MTQIAVIPDYLKRVIEHLETARERHFTNARRMDETTMAICHVEAQKMNLSRGMIHTRRRDELTVQ